jgi:hypothetical protein
LCILTGYRKGGGSGGRACIKIQLRVRVPRIPTLLHAAIEAVLTNSIVFAGTISSSRGPMQSIGPGSLATRAMRGSGTHIGTRGGGSAAMITGAGRDGGTQALHGTAITVTDAVEPCNRAIEGARLGARRFTSSQDPVRTARKHTYTPALYLRGPPGIPGRTRTPVSYFGRAWLRPGIRPAQPQCVVTRATTVPPWATSKVYSGVGRSKSAIA